MTYWQKWRAVLKLEKDRWYIIKYDRSKIKHDIKYDVIFKNIFGKIGNEKYIKKLVELILKIKVEKIDVGHDISIQKATEEEKAGVLDIMAVVNDKIIINIEMERQDKGNIIYRTEKYSSSIYTRNIKKGEKYEDSKEVILITILDYKINENEDYITNTMTVLQQNKEIGIQTKIKRYFIELPKIKKEKVDMENELEQWLIYISGREKEMIKMAIEKNKMIREIDEQVYYLQGEEAEARMQELRDKWDYTYMLGMASAREEGEIEGKREGKIDIAKKLLKMKIEKNIIMQATGLSEKELERI